MVLPGAGHQPTKFLWTLPTLDCTSWPLGTPSSPISTCLQKRQIPLPCRPHCHLSPPPSSVLPHSSPHSPRGQSCGSRPQLTWRSWRGWMRAWPAHQCGRMAGCDSCAPRHSAACLGGWQQAPAAALSPLPAGREREKESSVLAPRKLICS